MRTTTMMTPELLANAVPAVNKMAHFCNEVSPQIIKILDGGKIIKRLKRPTKGRHIKLCKFMDSVDKRGIIWWLEYNGHDVYLQMRINCEGVPGKMEMSKRLMLIDFFTRICSQKPQPLTQVPIQRYAHVVAQLKTLENFQVKQREMEKITMELRCELRHFIS